MSKSCRELQSTALGLQRVVVAGVNKGDNLLKNAYDTIYYMSEYMSTPRHHTFLHFSLGLFFIVLFPLVLIKRNLNATAYKGPFPALSLSGLTPIPSNTFETSWKAGCKSGLITHHLCWTSTMPLWEFLWIGTNPHSQVLKSGGKPKTRSEDAVTAAY